MSVTERADPIATYRRAVLIYNPNAGQLRGGGRRRLDRALSILSSAGHSVETIPTTGPNTAASIASASVARGADLILAAGGDGTINEVANGMIGSPVPLAILPAGTANVLAVEMGFPRRMDRAAAALSSCVPERIAAGLLRNSEFPSGRFFLLMAGAGLDADIVHHLDPRWKSALGKAAYWIGGFAQLGRSLPQFTIRTPSGSSLVSFALLSRVRNYGGDIEITRNACLLDDTFALALFEGRSAFRYLKYFLAILARRLDRVSGATLLTSSSAHLTPASERVYVQVDGEAAGWLPASVEIVPAALTLLTPPTLRARFRRVEAAAGSWTPSPTR